MGVNIFAIWRLSCGKRHAEKHCFHKLLLSLSICDLTHLIFTLFCFCLPRISETYDKEYNLFVLPYLIPLAQMSLCSSCFTTGQFQTRSKKIPSKSERNKTATCNGPFSLAHVAGFLNLMLMFAFTATGTQLKTSYFIFSRKISYEI